MRELVNRVQGQDAFCLTSRSLLLILRTMIRFYILSVMFDSGNNLQWSYKVVVVVGVLLWLCLIALLPVSRLDIRDSWLSGPHYRKGRGVHLFVDMRSTGDPLHRTQSTFSKQCMLQLCAGMGSNGGGFRLFCKLHLYSGNIQKKLIALELPQYSCWRKPIHALLTPHEVCDAYERLQ